VTKLAKNDPTIVSKNTGRQAIKNAAIFGLFPLYNNARLYAILLSNPHF
jgi:hypothetical protein